MLTPDEADEMLGLLRGMAQRKEITVIMITHKFREVTSFCDSVSVLRRGRMVGGGKVAELSTEDMARMMIGDTQIRERAVRGTEPAALRLELAALFRDDDEGLRALEKVNLKVHAGRSSVSRCFRQWQSELVEVCPASARSRRTHLVKQAVRAETRHILRMKIFGCRRSREERDRAAHDGAENMAPTFDHRPRRARLVAVAGPMRARRAS